MSALLKFVLVFIIFYYLINWLLKSLFPRSPQNDENNKKEVRLYKTKDVETAKYDIEAETVEYEEIKENES